MFSISVFVFLFFLLRFLTKLFSTSVNILLGKKGAQIGVDLDLGHCTIHLGIEQHTSTQKEGPSTFACKSENADRQDWYIYR